MTSGLENAIGKRVLVELLDGRKFTAKLKSYRGDTATFESKTGWRSQHDKSDIRRWRLIN